MTVALRSSATVTNGTAGTSVVVTKPAGTANGDILVAFIAELGTGTITRPAGWNLIGTKAGSTGVTLGAYWKLAASEGASWTWTLGSSVRNWGSVHAMTGVDTADPIASSSSNDDTETLHLAAAVDSLPALGYLLTAVAAARTASGSATSWTPFTGLSDWDTDNTELVDVGTNGGAGSDITGTVMGFAAPARALATSGWKFGATASQLQSFGAEWAVALNPAATAYGGGAPGVVVEAAFGADPDTDPDTWSWTDVTTDVRVADGIRITKGRADWATTASPSGLQFAVNNPNGDWTPEHPTGAHFPNIVIDLPVRVTLPYGYAAASRRITAFVDGYRPAWDPSAELATVSISASGRTRRAYKSQAQLPSPLYTTMIGTSANDIVPLAYWPCEDGSNATQFAAAVAGVRPGKANRLVTFGADTDLDASGPLPTLGAGSVATFTVPPYAATNQWVVQFVFKVPAEPGVETTIADLYSSGTARRFKYTIAPGSPSQLRLYMYDSTAALISSGFTNLDGSQAPTESQFYGQWVFHMVALADDGFGGGPTGYSGSTITSSLDSIGGTTAGASYGNLQQIKFYGGAGDASSLGHVWVCADASFDVLGADRHNNVEAFLAWSGETTLGRFARLCTERGIDYDFARQVFALPDSDTVIAMGPQARANFSSQMQEIERTEQGLMHDGGPDGEFLLDRRADRYNQDVALTADMAQGQLAVGFSPAFDDQRLVEDVTVSNRDGSFYRLGTSGNATTVQVNVTPEEWLAYLAGWVRNVGTAAGFRYLAISLNLRRSPELAAAWLQCQPGSRIQAVNLPSQHPSSTDADVILEGYTEVISSDRWTVDMLVSPYQPYEVFVVGDQDRGRLDTDGSALEAGASSGATSITVGSSTPDGPLWITTANRSQDFPFDINVGGERIRVTAIASLVAEPFTTTASSSWGSAPGGQAWTNSGGSASDFSRSGGEGLHSHAAANVVHESVLAQTVEDFDLTVPFRGPASAGPLSSAWRWSVLARYSANNYYRVIFELANSTFLATLTLQKIVAGVATTIASTGLGNLNYNNGSYLSIRFKGSGTTLRAKAWRSSAVPEPQGWPISITDGTFSSGQIGVQSLVVTGSTNAFPIVMGFDDFALNNPQVFTVTRSVNGVVKAQSAGESVSLWKPTVIAL